MGNFLPHAFVVEFVQLSFACLAFLFTIWTLYTAVRDAKALSAAKINGARTVIASGNVRAELTKLTITVIFIVIGVSSVLLPPPTRDWLTEFIYHSHEERLSITLNRVGLMVASVLMAYDSFAERRGRLRYVREMRAGKRMESTPPVVIAPPPGRDCYDQGEERERRFRKPSSES